MIIFTSAPEAKKRECNEAKNIDGNIILCLPPKNNNQLMMVTRENATGKQG